MVSSDASLDKEDVDEFSLESTVKEEVGAEGEAQENSARATKNRGVRFVMGSF